MKLDNECITYYTTYGKIEDEFLIVLYKRKKPGRRWN